MKENPTSWMRSDTRNDIIDPTAEAVEPYWSLAGTYLWTLSDADIEALRVGRLLVFCMEDYENVLIRLEVPK